MARNKITHEIMWEPIKMDYRIIRLTGSQRQPTMAEAQQYLAEHDLPVEIWVTGFFNNGEWMDASECKTLELWEYTAMKNGVCPICNTASGMYKTLEEKCPCCGREWGTE